MTVSMHANCVAMKDAERQKIASEVAEWVARNGEPPVYPVTARSVTETQLAYGDKRPVPDMAAKRKRAGRNGAITKHAQGVRDE